MLVDYHYIPDQFKVTLFILQIGKKTLRFRRRMSRRLLILSLPCSTSTQKINAAFSTVCMIMFGTAKPNSAELHCFILMQKRMIQVLINSARRCHISHQRASHVLQETHDLHAISSSEARLDKQDGGSAPRLNKPNHHFFSERPETYSALTEKH